MFTFNINSQPKEQERRIPPAQSFMGASRNPFADDLFSGLAAMFDEEEEEDKTDSLQEDLDWMKDYFQDLAKKVLEVREPRVVCLDLISVEPVTKTVKTIGYIYLKETEIEGVEKFEGDDFYTVKANSWTYMTNKVTLVNGSLLDVLQKELG